MRRPLPAVGFVVAEFVRVAAAADVPPGSLLGLEVDGRGICLANADGEFYAFQDNCSHRDFPLHSGELDGTQLECAWHGARFDIRTGRALRLPAIRPIRTYPVKVEDGEVWVEL